ncbi:MAG: hypothetical protein ACLRI8_09710 [Agathobacter rectalis]
MITNERYQYISSIIGSCVKKARAEKRQYQTKLIGLLQTDFWHCLFSHSSCGLYICCSIITRWNCNRLDKRHTLW